MFINGMQKSLLFCNSLCKSQAVEIQMIQDTVDTHLKHITIMINLARTATWGSLDRDLMANLWAHLSFSFLP